MKTIYLNKSQIFENLKTQFEILSILELKKITGGGGDDNSEGGGDDDNEDGIIKWE